MAEKQYHVFYREPVGNQYKHVKTYDEAEVLEFVRKANAPEHEYSNVSDVTVIYGAQLEFEPAEWVKSFKIKNS